MNTEISETAQITQFAAARPKLAKGQRPKTGGFSTNPPITRDEEGLTETAKNYRLRRARYDDWHKANALREYWRNLLKMNASIERVQHHGLPEGDRHPQHEPNPITHWSLHIARRLWPSFSLLPRPPGKSHGSARCARSPMTSSS